MKERIPQAIRAATLGSPPKCSEMAVMDFSADADNVVVTRGRMACTG
jgi:hypothetical protein